MNDIDFEGSDPTQEDLTILTERFIGFNNVDIDKIIYLDGWTDYEEDGGLLIFKNKENNLFILDYGYSVMADNHDEKWSPSPISQKHAALLIEEMKQTIKDVQRPMY